MKFSIFSRGNKLRLKVSKSLWKASFAGLALLFLPLLSFANVAGGGTGTGANVTVTQNGSNVVLSNGIVSFTIDTTNANTAVLDHIVQDVDRIGAAHVDRGGQSVDDVVEPVVVVAGAVGDEDGRALHARLAPGARNVVKVVVGVRERDALEGEVRDPVRGGSPGDIDELFGYRRFDIGGSGALSQSRVVVKRTEVLSK